MRKLLEKIYKSVIYYEQECIEAGKRVETDVDKLVEPHRGRLSEREFEELKNLIYSANYTAQYEGFMLGAKTIIKVLLLTILD